jgi:phospholipid/cholesterol/gamma-HCH transport system permease protein
MTAIADLFVHLGKFGLFVFYFLRSLTRNPIPVAEVMLESYRIGVRSLAILLVISFFVGTNLAVQGYQAFSPIGGQRLVGMFVALAGTRELAPVMVAAMIAAKAGTEMASQLAVMRIREQIDALEVMAIDPYWYLVTPRLLGITLVLPALTMISIVTLIFAAWGTAVLQLGLDGATFLQFFLESTKPWDLVASGIKAFVFGTLISLFSCFYGFYSDPGPSGVGRATNMAVVISAVSCAILNYVLSELLFA